MPRILIVDDEQQIRRILSVMLAERGFTVAEADSGETAIHISKEFQPDVALLDINMPGMSGLELLPKAKALRPDVPVIMITAYGDAETKRKALENCTEARHTKPIDSATLRNEIDIRVDSAA